MRSRLGKQSQRGLKQRFLPVERIPSSYLLQPRVPVSSRRFGLITRSNVLPGITTWGPIRTQSPINSIPRGRPFERSGTQPITPPPQNRTPTKQKYVYCSTLQIQYIREIRMQTPCKVMKRRKGIEIAFFFFFFVFWRQEYSLFHFER